jgi:UDP-glucose 4-epimerase
MINIVQKATEKQIPYKIYPRRDWDIAISLADPSKANNLLWRKAKLSIEDAIRDGRNFIQKQ